MAQKCISEIRFTQLLIKMESFHFLNNMLGRLIQQYFFPVHVPQMATRWDVSAVRMISQGSWSSLWSCAFSSLIRTELPKRIKKVPEKAYVFECACNM